MVRLVSTTVVTLSDLERDFKVAKYGDTSATYWNLYVSEADINDKKFIDSLRSDTNSMILLVSPRGISTSSQTLLSNPERSVLRHHRHIHHRDIQMLLPDNEQRSADLLSQLVKNSNPSQTPSPIGVSRP